MKKMKLSLVIIAMALCATAAFAQHGHGGGMGNSMGGTMGHSGSDHANSSSGSGSTQHMTIDQQLSKNTHLSSQIQKLTGMPATQACDGFRNLGQCVAAAHVSKNLDLSFDCMKADMTGKAPAAGVSCPTGTGSKSSSLGKMSLGKTIQTLDPKVDSKNEVKKATDQANEDMKQSSNS